MKRLQVQTETGWEYVFCRNAETNAIVTTKKRHMAIPGPSPCPSGIVREVEKSALDYFQGRYGNHEFRMV